MKILSLGDVPELKNLAKENGFTLHVRDACGGQAFLLAKIVMQMMPFIKGLTISFLN